MDAKTNDIAWQFRSGAPYEALDEKRQLVARHISERKHIARDMSSQDEPAGAGFGQRAADAVARFGGSWTFIGLFAATLFLWVGANSSVVLAILGAWCSTATHTFCSISCCPCSRPSRRRSS